MKYGEGKYSTDVYMPLIKRLVHLATFIKKAFTMFVRMRGKVKIYNNMGKCVFMKASVNKSFILNTSVMRCMSINTYIKGGG